jgi:hypothetical protein
MRRHEVHISRLNANANVIGLTIAEFIQRQVIAPAAGSRWLPADLRPLPPTSADRERDRPVGWIAAFVSSVALLPRALKLLRDRDAAGISLTCWQRLLAVVSVELNRTKSTVWVRSSRS